MTSVQTRAARIGIAAVALICLMAIVPAARAIECPEPQQKASPDVLKESSGQIKELAGLLASGDDRNRIGVIVDDLKAKFPSADDAALTNYMMAIYCQELKRDTGLSEAAKADRMSAFGRQVWDSLQ